MVCCLSKSCENLGYHNNINYLILSDQFHFREISTIVTEQDTAKCIKFYHSIQVLEKSFNSYVKDKIASPLMIAVPALEILGMYVWINLYNDITLPGFLVFPIMGINSAICNVLVFTLASHVNSLSERVLISLEKKMAELTWKKFVKREISAWSTMQIRFGLSYIDRGTPLSMQNFCINQTLSLTLVKSGQAIG